MKERIIKIQNFLIALGSLFAHPVNVPDILMEYRNAEDLKKDIEDINRERISTLFIEEDKAASSEDTAVSAEKTLSEELDSKKKELLAQYRKINESFEKSCIFHVGFGGGLFSELDSMMEFMLFCYTHHIRFELYADDANFSKPGGAGWEELFEPFCPINHDPLNSKGNYRPTDFQSLMRYHRLWTKGHKYPKQIKKNTGANYLTQDLWCMAISDDFKKTPVKWPMFGIDGPGEEEFAKVSPVAIIPKPEVRKAMDDLVAGIKLPEHFISMQIRGGDKYLEYDELVEADSFIKRVEILEEEYRACGKLEEYPGLAEKNVFIFTDDYRNVEYVKEKRPDWNVWTLTREDERGYFNEAFNKTDWEFKKSNLIKLLAIVETCVAADFHIGSNQSCMDMYLKSMKGTDKYIIV